MHNTNRLNTICILILAIGSVLHTMSLNIGRNRYEAQQAQIEELQRKVDELSDSHYPVFKDEMDR